jgi:hypothetical protein
LLQQPNTLRSYRSCSNFGKSSTPTYTHSDTCISDQSDRASIAYRNLNANITLGNYSRQQIASIKTQYMTTNSRYVAANEEVCRYEETHDIPVRWHPGTKEYDDGLILVVERKYRSALDDLNRLVVQRLFELTKLSMSGVGASALKVPHFQR